MQIPPCANSATGKHPLDAHGAGPVYFQRPQELVDVHVHPI